MTWERPDVEAPDLATSERAEANGRHIAVPEAAERGLQRADPIVTERGDRPPPKGIARRVTATWRLFAIRVLNYLTNHIVSHVPSFALRRTWYRHILGIQLGPHSGIYMGCYIWFYGPG